jgi:hypothetical protein
VPFGKFDIEKSVYAPNTKPDETVGCPKIITPEAYVTEEEDGMIKVQLRCLSVRAHLILSLGTEPRSWIGKQVELLACDKKESIKLQICSIAKNHRKNIVVDIYGKRC